MTGPIIHKPVLVQEVLTYLDPKPGGVYLDATFGSGGHTRAILEKEPTASVIAIDWDMQALEQFGTPLQEEFGNRLRLIWGNFALLYKICKKEGIESVDGILADFGTSQGQIKERAGFSFSIDSELDMRMSPAHQPVTAAQVIATSTGEKLRQIFWQLGQERYAKQITDAILQERKIRPIETTRQLADLITSSVPHDSSLKIHPATRVFQALRIYVNKELTNIESLLAFSMSVLKPGARLVCISFHSLEDRIVKQFFLTQSQLCKLQIITKSPIRASDEEKHVNPSSRSALLRAATRLNER